MRLDSVKACPFCGAKSISIRKVSTCYRAKCNSCEATAAFADSELEAIHKWNKRAGESV